MICGKSRYGCRVRDASVKVLTSAAAALIVFSVLTATSTVSPVWRIVIAFVAGGIAWIGAVFLGSPEKGTHSGSMASGLRGRDITVRGVKSRRRTHGDVASDIRARRDITIENIEDEKS